MLFNSFAYALFLPAVAIAYFALPQRWRWLLLLVASCGFYMAFVPVFILILAFTILVDYAAGILIEGASGSARRAWLTASIAANVSVLAAFKYFNFFSANATALLHLFGAGATLPLLHLVLPIGLSFHTFQSMSYTIEVYRGSQPAERHLGIFALYVMFFPQLVAGPIERPQNLLPQLRREARFDAVRTVSGLRLILWGLFKKIAIADALAPAVDLAYGNPGGYSGGALLMATYFFSLQIYCDFSGYSDVAIGSARILGIELMRNFDHPYEAASVPGFWRRWHMSLSTWFRDYVYFPLGGGRRHKRRNLVIVFLLSGLWHGANWTFVIWGALHAAYMVAHDFVAAPKTQLGRALRVVLTFHLVAFAWVFFRAPSLGSAAFILSRIPRLRPGAGDWLLGMYWYQLLPIGAAVAVLLLTEWRPVREALLRLFPAAPQPVRYCVYYAGALAVLFSSAGAPRQFIYFQF
jgi:D-alanyl-lipoteichoic acid acyltransferase DltB (MBOAT superfamily)